MDLQSGWYQPSKHNKFSVEAMSKIDQMDDEM